MSKQFFRFLVAGIINTAFSYLLYILLLGYLHYNWAYTIAYCAGVLLSYGLNTYFVFKQVASWSSFTKFPLVYLVQYMVGVIALWVLVQQLQIPPAQAMIAVIGVSIPLTFVLSKIILTK
ncbi:MAG: GtrA family protein [Sideroxydans sp.]|nr:GtrA family protein [Sideroxydans sp.]